jgi:antitoxin ParD1/3/4
MATVLETLQLPAETAAAIDALVAAGHAPSREAVVADLVAREVEDAAKRKALDAAIDEGIASGSCGMTLDELMAEFRHRHGRS